MTKNSKLFPLVLFPLGLAACTPPPPVNQSRDLLWEKYSSQSVDNVLMTMGTPARESKLTDGSRLLTYQYNTVYDYGSPYESQSGCEVTFLAQGPGFKVKNIAMKGGEYECAQLAQGRTGIIRHPYIAPMPPLMPYVPYGYPPYR